MAQPRQKLTEDDVKRLLDEPSPENRAATASRIAEQFGSDALSERERALAIDIFRLMVRDVEVRVREALSRQLKETPNLPHDVAMALARDVEAVALPMLHYSEVLSDDDLILIVRSQSGPKQAAVAGRRRVSPAVSQALVDHGDETAVARLVANQGAEISDESLHSVVTRFGNDERVQEGMVRRPHLPLAVAERLVTRVSEQLRDQLLQRPGVAEGAAAGAILHARERALLGMSENAEDKDVEALVAELQRNDRLTASIILRALCQGDVPFFEAAIARLAHVPLINARKLVHDPGPLGLPAIYARAGLPPPLYPAARAAMRAMADMELDGEEHDRERFSRRLMERILTQYGELGVAFEAADLEYLLDRLNKMAV